MANIKKSLIVTVYNEESSINSLLDSIYTQSEFPHELVIVDGGSLDKTFELIKKHKLASKIKVKVLEKKGNIAKGRNFAIENATGEVIAITDAGCRLDKKWFENITRPFSDKKIDIVAGYYRGNPKSNFQKALVPYVLVMPEKINESEFLPSARSMAMRRGVWKRLGGFSEKLNQSEDYDFARRAKNIFNIKFVRKAIVSWSPRESIFSAYKMFYKYAYGDIKAGILRPRVVGMFARYLFAVLSILAARFVSFELPYYLSGLYLLTYGFWSIHKNYKYVRDKSAVLYLPMIQIVSDIAVMGGSLSSALVRIANFLVVFAKKERSTFLAILLFIVLTLSIIKWGLPSSSHPFIYHMDEWHQLQSIRNLFIHLSPNMEGSANGPIFHFGLSGIYVAVLSILGLVNPFVINSSLDNLNAQNLLFVYLRLSTLFFSLGAVGLIIYILRKQLKVSLIVLPVVLFLFSPSWISLSNYFKYDIALLFWIILSILLIFKFSTTPNLKNYLLAALPVALAITTKISALPLFIIYVLAFFIYKVKPLSNLRYLFLGTILFLTIFFVLGVPDLFLGTGDYHEYFYSNLVSAPSETANYKLGTSYWIYLFTNQIPVLFGLSIVILFVFSLTYFTKITIASGIKNIFKTKKNEVFILSSFIIFAVSLIPLKLFIVNRSLVILPFVVLFIGLIFQKFIDNNADRKKIVLFIVSVLLILQIVQGSSWIFIKYSDPREISSKWILENIDKGSEIGIESVPIYQFLPDLVLKEYYQSERNIDTDMNYKYRIIDGESEVLPEYIVISNVDIAASYIHKSPKKSLILRMNKEEYEVIKEFKLKREINDLFATRLDFFISLLSPTPNIYIYGKP